MSLLATLVCALRGHEWKHDPLSLLEDRKVYTCSRCGETALHPPRYDDPVVPADQRD